MKFGYLQARSLAIGLRLRHHITVWCVSLCSPSFLPLRKHAWDHQGGKQEVCGSISTVPTYKAHEAGRVYWFPFPCADKTRVETSCKPPEGGLSAVSCYFSGRQTSSQSWGLRKRCCPSLRAELQTRRKRILSSHNCTQVGLVFKCLCSESGHSLKSVPIITGVTDGKDLWGHLFERCLRRPHLHTKPLELLQLAEMSQRTMLPPRPSGANSKIHTQYISDWRWSLGGGLFLIIQGTEQKPGVIKNCWGPSSPSPHGAFPPCKPSISTGRPQPCGRFQST